VLVVGIDPGSLVTGFAKIWEREGKLTRDITSWKSACSYPHRYMLMRERLEAFLLALPDRPSMVVIEKPLDILPQSGSLKNSFQLHGNYAVILAELARIFGQNLPMVTPTCRDWMKGVSARQLYPVLAQKYNYSVFTTDDEADALGLADYGYELLRSRHDRDAGRKAPEKDVSRVPQTPAQEPGSDGDSGLAARARAEDSLGQRSDHDQEPYPPELLRKIFEEP
jgi:hypothetical protein